MPLNATEEVPTEYIIGLLYTVLNVTNLERKYQYLVLNDALVFPSEDCHSPLAVSIHLSAGIEISAVLVLQESSAFAFALAVPVISL